MTLYCSGKFGVAVELLHRSCQHGLASKSQLVRHASQKSALCGRNQNVLLSLHIEPRTAGMRYFSQACAMRTLGRNGNRALLTPVCQPAVWKRPQARGAAMLVVRVLRGVLKLRYIVLGGAVGGGYTLNQSYEKWKQSLPDVKWLEEYMPDHEKINGFRNSLIGFSETVLNNVQNLEIDPRLRTISEAKMEEMKRWFNKRLESAIQAAEVDMNSNNASMPQGVQVLTQLIDKAREGKAQWFSSQLPEGTRGFPSTIHAAAFSERRTDHSKYEDSSQQRLEAMQAELMEIQSKYQKEVERLENENKELRRQTLLRGKAVESKRVKKSLIELYSEVLDELSGYDTSYQTADHLPRIVVVGDQSSGKTSVLEMIAQARIFPRGAGEMMTRAPVKVTLSEGPYHIAEFKDGNREYDLSKESDLADLRKEVERRMKKSVMIGETVSSEVISMSVKGPGLQRMVLVDLPGIISTVTTEMAEGTREAIKHMTETYMANPNAIILCIQDGSVDAERSNVTDLVAKMDPQGRRTIFVLTKVDLAEENLANPDRVKKILEGKLFPMKALGYFGVVTGRGRSDESIDSIREYEQQFFKRSKLMKNSGIMSSQVTTRNLTLAVAECFWKMVRDTVEQQADAFKATRFNLETEWKNTFPRLRELDRDELFEKARGEILDEVANLSQVSAHEWEKAFRKVMWDKMKPYVFENIYMSAAQARNPASFITSVDIKLKHLVENKLANDAVESGWEVLQTEFKRLMDGTKKAKNHDDIFDNLKDKVISEAMERHRWEDKAFNMLKASQLNVLEDRTITDKSQWADAVAMLEDTLKVNLKATDEMVREAVGPGRMEQWTKWSSCSKEQKKRSAVKSELDAILNSDQKHSSVLAEDETVTVKKNLQRKGLNVDEEYIRDTWHIVYRRNFLNQSLSRAVECRKGFFLYSQGMDHEMECADVLMFWKLNQIMKVTTTALRQQVMNREARRLEKEVKEVLEEYSQSREIKQKLLTGRRVTLAEELKRVRLIQEKLEDFIHRLNEK